MNLCKSYLRHKRRCCDFWFVVLSRFDSFRYLCFSSFGCHCLDFAKEFITMANIDNLTRTRRGHRSAVTKLINSIRAILTDFEEKYRIRLMSLQASLSDKGHLLDNLNQQILSLIENEDEIGTAIGRASNVDLTIRECLFEIQAVLFKKDNNPPSSNDTLNNTASRNSNSNGKLPSLNIKNFMVIL